MTPADHRATAAAAAAWLIRRQAGFSASDAAAFQGWLDESEEHRRAWEQADAVWDAVDAEDDPLLDAMRTDALSARPERRQPILGWAMRAAAVLVAGVLGVTAWRTMTLTPAPIEYSASARPMTLALADTSRVVLDPGTKLEVAFSSRRRDLKLSHGRAQFDVHHEDRPFAVEAADVTVTATGTRFTVEVLKEGVLAALDRGSVVVTRKQDPQRVTLSPGQRVLVVQGKPMRVIKVDAAPAAPRYLEFRDTPLAEAAVEVSRQSTTPVHVVGAAAKLKLSGRFRVGDAAGFIAAVTAVLPVQGRPSADGGVDLSLKPKR